MSTPPSADDLSKLHALAQATLQARDARVHRAHLDQLALYTHDLPPFDDDDARSDAQLGAAVTDASARRRFAARLRGVVLGCAAHPDAVVREVVELAKVAVAGEGIDDREIERRTRAAFELTRWRLESDIVQLAPAPAETMPASAGARARRWGVVRSLELNAFAATFTRDGTSERATSLTQSGREAGALRFAVATAQVAMTLARDTTLDEALRDDIDRVETALEALLAAMCAALRNR